MRQVRFLTQCSLNISFFPSSGDSLFVQQKREGLVVSVLAWTVPKFSLSSGEIYGPKGIRIESWGVGVELHGIEHGVLWSSPHGDRVHIVNLAVGSLRKEGTTECCGGKPGKSGTQRRVRRENCQQNPRNWDHRSRSRRSYSLPGFIEGL